MKKLIIIVLFAGFALCNASCNKEATAQAQTTINSFVTTYFPDAQILSIIKDGLDYEVTLSDYTHIEFDGNLFSQLEWDEVDCRCSTTHLAVPNTLVPAEIKDYVTRLHTGRSIVKISRDRFGWEIELDNDLDIEFSRKFVVIEMD